MGRYNWIKWQNTDYIKHLRVNKISYEIFIYTQELFKTFTYANNLLKSQNILQKDINNNSNSSNNNNRNNDSNNNSDNPFKSVTNLKVLLIEGKIILLYIIYIYTYYYITCIYINISLL